MTEAQKQADAPAAPTREDGTEFRSNPSEREENNRKCGVNSDEGIQYSIVLEESNCRLKAKNNNLHCVEAQMKEKEPYLTFVCRCT